MSDSGSKVITERFNDLKEKLENFKNEDIDLEVVGIKELNTKLSFLVELETSVKDLVKAATEEYKDEELIEYTNLMGEINSYILSLNEVTSELREAQRNREKLNNKVNDELKKLEENRNEYDYKISDALENSELEKKVLDLELTDVDKKYHNDLLKVYQDYVDALNEERKPIDELFDKYTKEVELLLEGGKLNYKLEDGDLVELNNQIREIEVPKFMKQEELTNEEENIEDIRAEVAKELEEAEEREEPVKEETQEPLSEELEVPNMEEMENHEETVQEEPQEELNTEFAFPALEPVLDEEPIEEKTQEPLSEELEVPNMEEMENHEETVQEEPQEELNTEFAFPALEPVLDEEPIEEKTQEPLSEELKVPNMEGHEEDGFNNFNPFPGFDQVLGDNDEPEEEKNDANNGEIVVGQKEVSSLSKKAVQLNDSANEYMSSLKKEETQKNETKTYMLKEGETLSAEVTDENGEKKTVEIDSNGKKTIKDEEGNTLATEYLTLDEGVKDGEPAVVVTSEDLNLSILEEKGYTLERKAA